MFHKKGASPKQKGGDWKRIGIKKVCELLEEAPYKIVMRLGDPYFGLDSYLAEERMGDNLVIKFTQLIDKALTCNSMTNNLVTIAKKLLNSHFFQETVYAFLSKRTGYADVEYNLDYIETVLNIVCRLIELDPYSVEKCIKVRDKLELTILTKAHDQSLIDKFEHRLIPIETAAMLKVQRIQSQSRTFKNVEYSEPPNDFTEMSIVPSFIDILSDQSPFLRKNITNGAYQSVHHYLDVQFRLLREDYLQPLREGIGKFRSIMNGSVNRELSFALKSQLKSIQSLSTYFNVTLDSTLIGHSVVYQLKLSEHENVKWEDSKKLMFGSLVCLSSDFFQSECIVGTVSERDSKKLKKGLVSVRFELEETAQAQFNNAPEFNKSYTMVETQAYFEAYKHVLEALVSFKDYSAEDFPFKEHLIDCQNKIIKQPEYLKNVPFDFRTIIDPGKKVSVNRDGFTTYQFSSEVGKKCYLSQEAQWPDAEKMKLDNSQYKAVQLALSNRIALIQGPPGTGKTFIGVKIMELLMNNKSLWWNRPGQPKRPILMICYTNHALDQFLEYCIDECHLGSGIVRVGGRCANERLEPFLLSTVKKNLRDTREMDPLIYHRIKNGYEDLESLKNKFENVAACLKQMSSGVIEFESLKEVIDHDTYEELCDYHQLTKWGNRYGMSYSMLIWLGFFDLDSFDPNEEHLSSVFKSTVSLDENNDEEAELEAMNYERLLEADYDSFTEQQPGGHYRSTEAECIAREQIKEMCIAYNQEENSRHLGKFLADEKQEWMKVKSKNKVEVEQSLLDRFIDFKLNELLNSSECLEKPNKHIRKMNLEERHACYRSWLHKYKKSREEDLIQLNIELNKSAKNLSELRLQEDRFVMRNAMIIAMTTTGSSRYHNVLKDIGPRIVIVEEAAEVFEAHVVSSLSKHCEHLILIGDHVQLRPNPAVYKLARTFQLDVSLFERLIKNDIKRVMLSTQHRMRPEISCLMCHFYPEPINDHPSVNAFPNIIGLYKNIFFLDHKNPETRQADLSSKLNQFEADFIVEMCLYFVKQKYEQSTITVLSMYQAQMRRIRVQLRQIGLNHIKVTTVDNYQGEENHIVILSLVRSNKEEKIGFLATDNRVCVALSRAKYGFYCIGNMDLMARNSETWSNIISSMKESANLGEELTLTCGTHPKNDIKASRPDQFRLRPDGGCQLPCDFRLKCGHVCSLKCHTFDLEHEAYECEKTCDKKMDCGHSCTQTCCHSGQCEYCPVKVLKQIKECGHDIKIRCDKQPAKKDCEEPCPVILPCGHQCTKLCGQECGPCQTLVDVTKTCKHSPQKAEVYCSDKDKVWLHQTSCKEKCSQVLECEHVCNQCCADCFGGYMHAECTLKCDRILYCGHKCTMNCPLQCGPCQRKCENRCPHSKCMQKCSTPCSLCKESCTYECKHMKCSRLCHEICDRSPCQVACDKRLKCGHRCIGLCGEPCPSLCRICHETDEAFSIFFGTEDETDAKFVLLEDCGHIVESTGMDGYMASKSDNGSESTTIKLPECPRCCTPIRFTLRYLNYVKAQLNAIELIKKKEYGSQSKNKTDTINFLEEIKDHRGDLIWQGYSPSIFDFKYYDSIESMLGKSNLSASALNAYINSWKIYFNLQNTEFKMQKKKDLVLTSDQSEHLKFEMKKLKALFNQSFSYQRLYDLKAESERIDCLFELFACQNSAPSNSQDLIEISNLVALLEECLFKKVQVFDGDAKKATVEALSQLKKLTKVEISEQEKKMIHAAMGFGKGHWFECPNGHVYCITECGGAMEQSKCPECKEAIGGTCHQLIATNRLTSQMDGATHAAWSETANNMNNWDIDD